MVTAHLGLEEAEQDRLRRVGLVHDLGKIAVPYRLLENAGDDTDAPRRRGGTAALAEPVRLHPYYAQCILSRIRPFADLAGDVSAHHERLDGSGYPLGNGGQDVPIGARVLAAADSWAERAGNGPPDLTGEDGLHLGMHRCPPALHQARFPAPAPAPPPTPAVPSLSPREMEVLRLVA
jgi:HD domain